MIHNVSAGSVDKMRKSAHVWLSLLMVSAGCAASQAQRPLPGVTMEPVGWKDPTVATLLGLVISGGGQFYSEHEAKGSLLLGMSIIGGVLAATASNCYSCANGVSSAQRDAGLGLAISAWLVGWVSAPHDAQSHNDRLLERLGLGASADPCHDKQSVARDGDNLHVVVFEAVSGGQCTEAQHCAYRDAAGWMSRNEAVRRCRAEEIKRE